MFSVIEDFCYLILLFSFQAVCSHVADTKFQQETNLLKPVYLQEEVLKRADTEIVCDPTSYNYDQNGDDWEDLCQTGEKQSPIPLNVFNSTISSAPRIRFRNYEYKLRSPLTLTNNGHSANLELEPRDESRRAYITGGYLRGKYEAQSVHFHWGSRNSKGSEHIINGERYDIEMHIVHKNARYKSVDEAAAQNDGLAVLGVMIRGVPYNVRPTRLVNIFDNLPDIIDCGDMASISATMSVGDLLGNIVTGQYFSYNGSLTTPNCDEAVAWTVFTDVIEVSQKYIKRFWSLMDNRGQPLINNYRNLQDIFNRTIYFRSLNNYI